MAAHLHEGCGLMLNRVRWGQMAVFMDFNDDLIIFEISSSSLG
jgi:hypothetical protein